MSNAGQDDHVKQAAVAARDVAARAMVAPTTGLQVRALEPVVAFQSDRHRRPSPRRVATGGGRAGPAFYRLGKDLGTLRAQAEDEFAR